MALLLPTLGAISMLQTIPNFRDLGGMPAVGGSRMLRPGVLHRSASPSNASLEDAHSVLQTIGVRTVLDLRGEKDATKDHGPRHLMPSTTYLPLLTSDMMRSALLGRARTLGKRGFAKLVLCSLAKKVSPSRRLRTWFAGEVDLRLAKLLDTVSLYDLYRLIVDQRQKELKQAAEMCASGEALPMLVHCTHGKDRTGVLVALLLYACEVPESVIVADYALSESWGTSVEGKWHVRQALPERVRHHVDQKVLDQWCEAPEEVLTGLFDALREEYGSVEAYLDSIGVDVAMRSRLRETLTVPASA